MAAPTSLLAASSDALIPTERLVVVTGPTPGVPFKSPRAIAVDAKHGEVLVANSGEHRIEVFDLEGNRRAALWHRVCCFDGSEVDGLPSAIALDRDGHMLVSDHLATYVDVLDYRGRSVARLAWDPQGGTPLASGPGAIAVASDGTILVATRGKDGRVHQFAPKFTYVGAWGVAGTEPGMLSNITGLAITPDGNVVVTAQATELAVQIFTRNGKFLRGFGKHDFGAGNFSFPSGVVATRDGRIWVSDEIRHTIQVFDSAGNFVGMVGSAGKVPVEFLYPSAVASDGDGLLAVAERVGNRFQVLRVR